MVRGGREVVIATDGEWVKVGWSQSEGESGSSSIFFHDAAVFSSPFIQQARLHLAPVQLFAVPFFCFAPGAAGSAAVCLTATHTAWRTVTNTPEDEASFHIFSHVSVTVQVVDQTYAEYLDCQQRERIQASSEPQFSSVGSLVHLTCLRVLANAFWSTGSSFHVAKRALS